MDRLGDAGWMVDGSGGWRVDSRSPEKERVQGKKWEGKIKGDLQGQKK